MAQDANQRWDNLQKRVASILRRLKVPVLTGSLLIFFLRDCIFVQSSQILLTVAFFSPNTQHFISQREEFETARDGILVWLTEMDLQLTNIEHFSECDIQAKIKQLRVGLRFPQASSPFPTLLLLNLS